CGCPDCPATGGDQACDIVVRVIAEQAAIDAATTETDHTVADTAAATDTAAGQPAAARPAAPALLLGRGVLPNALLAAAIRAGARVKPIRMPGPEPEPHYRPSAALAEFIRARDLFCRFPGCDVPAEFCDIDHAQPWPYGPTHPSNLNCKCRPHHLLKTFWTGIGGWADKQLPDGSVIWTAPSGQTFTTQPGCRLFFPTWNVTTAELPPPATPPPATHNRGLKMPRRHHTRTADRIAAITTERTHNHNNTPPF
ncbi:HNH endonuclease, partial [Mycolicibacterium moriokaense]